MLRKSNKLLKNCKTKISIILLFPFAGIGDFITELMGDEPEMLHLLIKLWKND